jgi:uncharacterized protein YgiM (DUF1202 family)
MLRLLCLTSFSILASLNAAPAAQPKNAPANAVKKVENFKPFTGKILADKVRVRAKPDLDSHIVRQLHKNDLLLVVDEEGDFYAVEPLKDTRAYVFRSYILDNIVEANRVNIRLEPHVDAPIIGQLHAGEKVTGNICPMNHKWLEITPPKGTRFFVSKEFVTSAGGPEYLGIMEKRKAQVEELLTQAFLAAETECKKSFEDMESQTAMDQFQAIIQRYADFPEAVAQAKEGLALLKDTYLNKKIAFLESKSELSTTAKEELLAKHKAENSELLAETAKPDQKLWSKRSGNKKGHEGFWSALEESLYLSWTAFHSGKTMADYYIEQRANATAISGKLERYTPDVKNKPGDFVLRGPQDIPLAYLYSTQVDLDSYAGKEVTVLASPRPNNHFAFPAFFVLSVK